MGFNENVLTPEQRERANEIGKMYLGLPELTQFQFYFEIKGYHECYTEHITNRRCCTPETA